MSGYSELGIFNNCGASSNAAARFGGRGRVCVPEKEVASPNLKPVWGLMELETSKIVVTTLELSCGPKDSVENAWYPVNPGESELMALVGGACEGIATRDQSSKMCKCSPGTIVLCTDSSAALGFVKRKGASRRTRHEDKKVAFMQVWAMELGQRILKVHVDTVNKLLSASKVTTPRAPHRKALRL